MMPKPCDTCPYRTDVPSGLWAEEEYEKLVKYDKPTGEQPFTSFNCHSSPQSLCRGWYDCHMNRGREYDLVSVRLLGVPHEEPSPIEVFGSGMQAYIHGMAEIDNPPQEAITKLKRKIDGRKAKET